MTGVNLPPLCSRRVTVEAPHYDVGRRCFGVSRDFGERTFLIKFLRVRVVPDNCRMDDGTNAETSTSQGK